MLVSVLWSGIPDGEADRPAGPRRPATWPGRAADAALEASIAGSFSRLGFVIRSRLLPEFAAGDRPSFRGRMALVTGGTSGLGLAIATDLARRGGIVHFMARDPARADRARRQIMAAAGSSTVSYGIADMTELGSIRQFASDFAAQNDRLDVLVHNAGTMYPSYQLNGAGLERTYAGQVLGPFALTTLLLPQLLAAAPSRVIVMSSGGMYTQPLARSVDPMGPGHYRGATAYARAKRAQVALNSEWARRSPAADLAFHALHPGWADTPGIAASLPRFHRVLGPALRSAEQGADTAVWLATADAARLSSGLFWHDRRPRRDYLLQPRSADRELARTLWDRLAAIAGRPLPSAADSRPGGEDQVD
jgi:dehydrogenase/reductase SDR family protein 12